nr:BTB/POZ domain-containing protein 6-like [Aedes albopictus]
MSDSTEKSEETMQVVRPNNNLSKAIVDFTSDLSPIEILTLLVNNDYQADVMFQVGQFGTLMYAHKNIITLASKVFFAQFNGQFADGQQDSQLKPIIIKDIEPSTMQEVLSYVYCRQVSLTTDNMMDLYYAAKKYMLGSLQVLCEDAFRREIDDDTVLEIFSSNSRQYQFEFVNELCFNLICENPLKFFKQDRFVELDQGALKILVEKKMNCHESQLKEAIAKWEIGKEAMELSVEPRDRLCRKLYLFGRPRYDLLIDTDITLQVQSRIALYGIGVLVGVKYDTFVPGSFVTIEVKINQKLVATKSVELSENFKTCEIMFEKVNVDERCIMQVIVDPSNNLRDVHMFCLSEFDLADTLGGSEVTIPFGTNHTCISYLLCQADADDADDSDGFP